MAENFQHRLGLGRMLQLFPLRRNAVAAYGKARVVVIATGGMSHQISGARFGMANEELDRRFLARLGPDLERLVAIPQQELIRAGGTDAVELTMWYAMRAALADEVEQVYDFYTFPQITGCGVVVFEETQWTRPAG